jgi:hypothetical protein
LNKYGIKKLPMIKMKENVEKIKNKMGNNKK